MSAAVKFRNMIFTGQLHYEILKEIIDAHSTTLEERLKLVDDIDNDIEPVEFGWSYPHEKVEFDPASPMGNQNRKHYASDIRFSIDPRN